MPSARRMLVVGVLAVGAAACADDAASPAEPAPVVTQPPGSSEASDTPAVTDVGPTTTTAPEGIRPEGFTTVTARITEADGEVCDVCVWLADDTEERGRGLMGVTDLGDPVGMVFRFDDPVANSFYMLNTPTPLSIAWFVPGGEFLSATDMEPCVEVPDGGCPLYSPGASYDLALEVFEGGLAELGVGPGARLELVAGTEGDSCAVTL